jgi:cytochrome c-type biogenesis protein CcmH/NrfG
VKAAYSLVSAVLLSLLLSVSALSQGGHTLQGRVITPNGSQPTAPVRVTLTISGRRVYETFTDLSGRFSFPGLARGTYQLTAEGDDRTFVDTSVYAEVSAFGNAPQLFTQDIQLRPIAGKPVSRATVINAFTQEVPKTAREKLERANKLADQGKNEAAIVEIQEAIRIFPRYFEAHLSLGNQLLKAGRLDDAILALDVAREINPNDERLYQSFGLLLMRQKNYPVAVAIFTEASRLNPANAVNPLMRATALIYQASTIDPTTSENLRARSNLLLKAELALLQVDELSGKKIKADSVTLAMFYDLKGEPARAADELEDYLQKKPGSKNSEAVRQEITRLRLKASSKTSP